MPIQNTILPVSGTLGGITYYTREGKHLCRMKTATKSNTFRARPSYAKQRQVTKRATRCMKLASAIYQLIPKQQRKASVWASLLKCLNNPFHIQKPMDHIINVALLQFNIIHPTLAMSQREAIFQQIRSSLPFASLDADPREDLAADGVRSPTMNRYPPEVSE